MEQEVCGLATRTPELQSESNLSSEGDEQGAGS